MSKRNFILCNYIEFHVDGISPKRTFFHGTLLYGCMLIGPVLCVFVLCLLSLHVLWADWGIFTVCYVGGFQALV